VKKSLSFIKVFDPWYYFRLLSVILDISENLAYTISEREHFTAVYQYLCLIEY